MVNMSAKFDKEAHKGVVTIVFTSLFPYMSIVTWTFDFWPPKSIGFIHPLIMVNTSAKFDKETCNGVVSIVFTRSMDGRTEGRTDTRTEPQQRYYIPTATHCAGKTSKLGELWSPTRQKLWPWIRSKVKVTAWCQLKGLVTRIMHAQYQCSIINTSEDMSKVTVFVTEGQTDRRTEGRMSFNVPCFPKRRGTTKKICGLQSGQMQ